MDKLAIIDLGSNTFHLLIAGFKDDDSLHEVYRERVYVKLAKEGKERIGDESFRKGISTLQSFRKKMKAFDVSQFTAVGTAMLRNAQNAGAFIEVAADLAQVPIQVIDGETEAILIHKGIKSAIKTDGAQVIMDIGGGSVEFIIAQNGEIAWKHSYNVGVSYLKNKFSLREKPTAHTCSAIYRYLEEELKELQNMLTVYKPETFIGSAGTFEVLEKAVGHRDTSGLFGVFDMRAFDQLYSDVMSANHSQLMSYDWLPEERRDLIQPAFILINWISQQSAFKKSVVSHRALKEGGLMDYKYQNHLVYNNL